MNRNQPKQGMSRRSLIQRGMVGGLGLSLVGNQFVLPFASATDASADNFGPLERADENGVRLPAGFTSRVVATSGVTVENSSYVWHASPDGGATFATEDGGWVYVSNSELGGGTGGVGAIKFASDGQIVDGYSILSGTTRNCAGGPTPWGTWLSCEETSTGEVWECDPLAPGSEGIVRPLLGKFSHEAAAVDPINEHIYLTEDRSSGLLYRFLPSTYPSLDAGTLQVAEILDPSGDGPITLGERRNLTWHEVPDPTVSMGISTRKQIAEATTFNGGEGCWYEAGLIYFSTKGDDRVWKIDIAGNEISIVYDAGEIQNPILTGVDNVFVSPNGEVYVAEDTGDMQIVALSNTGQVIPILQVEISGSEICGPALSPDGTRLYFSSQRNPGTTFEISGPWLESIDTSSEPVSTLGLVGSGLLATDFAAWGARRARSRN